MSETVKLVYRGLTEKQKKAYMDTYTPEAMRKACNGKRRPYHDGFYYPEAPQQEFYYLPKKRDNEAEKRRKELRRKQYREARVKEIEQHIADQDMMLEVCGLVFEKDVPTEVNMAELEKGEYQKLFGDRGWVAKGRLELWEEPQKKEEPLKKGPGPKDK